MEKYTDGYHAIGGVCCYVEDGGVKWAVLGKGDNQRTAYPYRRVKDGWTEAVGVKPATLRAGLRRETYSIQ